jgi:hypothetical protein
MHASDHRRVKVWVSECPTLTASVSKWNVPPGWRTMAPANRGRFCSRRVCEVTDMSKNEVDVHLAALEEPKHSTLDALRPTILEVIPSAEQGL